MLIKKPKQNSHRISKTHLRHAFPPPIKSITYTIFFFPKRNPRNRTEIERREEEEEEEGGYGESKETDHLRPYQGGNKRPGTRKPPRRWGNPCPALVQKGSQQEEGNRCMGQDNAPTHPSFCSLFRSNQCFFFHRLWLLDSLSFSRKISSRYIWRSGRPLELESMEIYLNPALMLCLWIN